MVHFTSTFFTRHTQMKRILLVAAVVSALACSVANAASVSVRTGAPGAYSIFLDGQEADGNFDTVFVELIPSAPATFTNQNSGLQSGAPRPAGQAFSYRNRLLDLDPTDPDNPGGLGWTVVGAVSTANALSFTGGPLGCQDRHRNADGEHPWPLPGEREHAVGHRYLQGSGHQRRCMVQELTGIIPEPASFGFGELGSVRPRRVPSPPGLVFEASTSTRSSPGLLV